LPNATATRNCRSIDDLDAGIAGVSGASVVLAAEVAVKVPLGCRVSFDLGEILQVLDQGESPVGTSGNIRKLRGTKAADAVATYDLKSNIKSLGQ
jgi:hypothetical protein